jgi:hypothetical protein
MTCAGISSLILCNQMLASTQRAADAVKTPQPRDENAAARDRAIQQGTDWLTRYFAVGINPGEGSSGFLDYINGMARVGRLCGLRFFGKHDWYRDEAAFLVGGQSARDGSWQALDVESDKRIATSLALLFLCERSGSAATIKVNDARPHLDKSGPRKRSFGGKTFQAYGIDAVPESAVIGRDGRIAYIGHLGQALETVARLAQAK